MLQSNGFQRVGHNLATEQQQGHDALCLELGVKTHPDHVVLEQKYISQWKLRATTRRGTDGEEADYKSHYIYWVVISRTTFSLFSFFLPGCFLSVFFAGSSTFKQYWYPGLVFIWTSSILHLNLILSTISAYMTSKFIVSSLVVPLMIRLAWPNAYAMLPLGCLRMSHKNVKLNTFKIKLSLQTKPYSFHNLPSATNRQLHPSSGTGP